MVHFCGVLRVKMDMFSLEEDDNYHNMFITQTPKDTHVTSEDNYGSFSGENDQILGINALDFQSPFSSLVTNRSNVTHYSDISDEEFDIPLSQNTRNIRLVI